VSGSGNLLDATGTGLDRIWTFLNPPAPKRLVFYLTHVVEWVVVEWVGDARGAASYLYMRCRLGDRTLEDLRVATDHSKSNLLDIHDK
jgi:hypothetical protein